MIEMQSKALKVVPTFESEAEERAFCLTHDSTTYLHLSEAQRAEFANLKLSKRDDFELYLSKVPDAPAQAGDERG
mgnify:FL=1